MIERVHFDKSTVSGNEGLQNWFHENKKLWQELIEQSGVEQAHADAFSQILKSVRTDGWSHGDEQGDYTYALLRKWADYLGSVNPAILQYDDALKRQDYTGEKPENLKLSPEDLTLLNLFRELRADASKSITRKTT